MTYCVALKTETGLIALADGRITAGTQMTSAHKVSLLGDGNYKFFMMTSGLRSARDKTVAYLTQEMEAEGATPFRTMLDVLAAYTKHLRKTEQEDRASLQQSGIKFDLHTIIGGMMEGDKEPRLFLVYPEGNWIEVEQMTPYVTIGATMYGKPILDRALRYNTDMQTAIKIAYLSFDSTKFSSSDVGFPIDIITLHKADRSWREIVLGADDVRDMHDWWNEHIMQLTRDIPSSAWVPTLLP